MRKGRKEASPTHQPFRLEFAAYGQQELLLCCLKIILIFALFWFAFSLLTAKSSHTGFAFFERSLSDSLKMPATHRKIVPGEYYFKIRIDSARRNEALCGCWVECGDMAVKNDTASWAISFSGSKRNIWLDSAPKNTNPAQETAWVGSRQPSKQTPPALLASDTICSRSYSVSELGVSQWSPCAGETYCNVAGQGKMKRCSYHIW